MGAEVCGEVSETEKALDRVAQAARYIVQARLMEVTSEGLGAALGLAFCQALLCE